MGKIKAALQAQPTLKIVVFSILILFITYLFCPNLMADQIKVKTPTQLVNCANGTISSTGDTCVLFPGTYSLTTRVTVTVENLRIRSTDGSNTVAIDGSGLPGTALGVVVIQQDGVMIDGITMQNGPANVSGILIQAEENITIQNSRITGNGGSGIRVVTPSTIQGFKILHNQVINNSGRGLVFGVQVRSVEGVTIANNEVGPNTLDNLAFLNNGTVEQVEISNNQLDQAGTFGNGILFGGQTTDIEHTHIVKNTIQGNGASGIEFGNTGRIEDVEISQNQGPTPQQGITGNGRFGILVRNSVRDIRGVTVKDNPINSNQINDGILLANTGEVEDLQIEGNELRRNGQNGLFAINGDDFSRSQIKGNKFVTNGTNTTGAGLNITHTGQRIENLSFSKNQFRENDLQGVRLVTTSGDISGLSFTKDSFTKNSNTGLSVSTTAGDISRIDFKSLSSKESEAGSGAELITETGDIREVNIAKSSFIHNGSFGLRIAALLAPPGEIRGVTVKNSTFNRNGARQAVGGGSGLQIVGERAQDVTLTSTTSQQNSDYGVHIEGIDMVSDILLEKSQFNNNGTDKDKVGDGIRIKAAEDILNVAVKDNQVHKNDAGVVIKTGPGASRSVEVKNNSINKNPNQGVLLYTGEALAEAKLLNNVIKQNGSGISLVVKGRGNDIQVKGNKVYGAKKQGIGLLLKATNVSVTKNSFREFDTGISAHKSTGNHINGNNIARNKSYGVDGSGLTKAIDATKNWWGEPSGPKHPQKNPHGLGNPVTDRVKFKPFLKKPIEPTLSQFEIVKFDVPSQAEVGVPVTISYAVKNNGEEEGVQEIKLKITNADGDVIETISRTATVNPKGKHENQLEFTFSQSGEYTVSLETKDDRREAKIQVGVKPIGKWPPVWKQSGIFPSPVDVSLATLHIEGQFDRVTLMIFTLSYPAQKVLDQTYDANDADVNLAKLDNGVYLYVLIAEKDGKVKKSPVKKLLVQR